MVSRHYAPGFYFGEVRDVEPKGFSFNTSTFPHGSRPKEAQAWPPQGFLQWPSPRSSTEELQGSEQTHFVHGL
jgi:hypothetical protein